MHDLVHRVAIALLVISGLLTLFAAVGSVDASQSAAIGSGALPLLLVQHWRFMVGLLGAGLLLATFLPTLRLPTVGAAALSKAAFAAIALSSGIGEPSQWLAPAIELAWAVLLLAAGAVFLREAWQEARWNGMLRLPSEA